MDQMHEELMEPSVAANLADLPSDDDELESVSEAESNEDIKSLQSEEQGEEQVSAKGVWVRY